MLKYSNLISQILAIGAAGVLAFPRPLKRSIVIVLDIGLCMLAVWIAFYLRLGEFVSYLSDESWAWGIRFATLSSILCAIPIFVFNGLYRLIFRYSGWPVLLIILRATLLYTFVFTLLFTVIGIPGVPRTVGIIQPIVLLMLVALSRVLAMLWLSDQYVTILKNAARPKVLIYGAGRTGRQLATAIGGSPEMQVVGFLDDDDRLHGHVLNGLPIYDPKDLSALAESLTISTVLLAMPNVSRYRRNAILENMQASRVAVRTLPSMLDLASGRVSVADLRELDIDDLLGRDPVAPNTILLGRLVSSKVILVTGAGGSIGRQLCRQIVSLFPQKLLLLDQSEFHLYQTHAELEALNPGLVLVPLLASVQNEARIEEIISTWRPHTVYHAAAYKHVPLVEQNPVEGVKNNVFGTLVVAQAAVANGVSDLVLVSTDKAVRPTNVMGATKRLSELILQGLAQTQKKTRFSMVRFGNVLGSSGSVVPKFRQQIREGGPITVTHPEVTRYFMTVAEAAELVIQAGAMAKGGDVFVLDMGQPVRIIDLARRMVELSGLTMRDETNPQGDIAIEITGLRPGEKLFEELLIGDNPESTLHPRIMKAREKSIPWHELEQSLSTLSMALSVSDVAVVVRILQDLIPEYTPDLGISDLIYVEQIKAD